MYEKLGVKEGCVTPFALINDKVNNMYFVYSSKSLFGLMNFDYNNLGI